MLLTGSFKLHNKWTRAGLLDGAEQNTSPVLSCFSAPCCPLPPCPPSFTQPRVKMRSALAGFSFPEGKTSPDGYCTPRSPHVKESWLVWVDLGQQCWTSLIFSQFWCWSGSGSCVWFLLVHAAEISHAQSGRQCLLANSEERIIK